MTVAAPHFFPRGLDSPPFLPFGGILLDPKSLWPHHLSIHIDLKHKYGEVHNSSTKMMIMVTGSTYCSHL